jgi:hypothetical protein
MNIVTVVAVAISALVTGAVGSAVVLHLTAKTQVAVACPEASDGVTPAMRTFSKTQQIPTTGSKGF